MNCPHPRIKRNPLDVTEGFCWNCFSTVSLIKAPLPIPNKRKPRAETCMEGHPYLRDSRGSRYCPTCRRAQLLLATEVRGPSDFGRFPVQPNSLRQQRIDLEMEAAG